MKFVPGAENYEGRSDEWFREETTKVVTTHDGENVAVPMTNWHWRTLDWICTEDHGTISVIVGLAVMYAEEEGIGFPESLQMTVESYLDSVTAFQASKESA